MIKVEILDSEFEDQSLVIFHTTNCDSEPQLSLCLISTHDAIELEGIILDIERDFEFEEKYKTLTEKLSEEAGLNIEAIITQSNNRAIEIKRFDYKNEILQNKILELESCQIETNVNKWQNTINQMQVDKNKLKEIIQSTLKNLENMKYKKTDGQACCELLIARINESKLFES